MLTVCFIFLLFVFVFEIWVYRKNGEEADLYIIVFSALLLSTIIGFYFWRK